MKPLEPAKLNLLSLARLTEEQARAMLERLRWPNGPVCPHCGVVGEAKRMESAEESETKLRGGVWNCRACRKPFTVTVGTIFEGSHIPLAKWLLGFYLFASSKKSLSAAQLQRQLNLGSYRTAWHMAHRIRHAMENDPDAGKLSGIVEADETYVGGKVRKGSGAKGDTDTKRRQAAQKAWSDKRVPVAVLVSRDGKARARAMQKVTGKRVTEFIAENVDMENSTLHTDEAPLYVGPGRKFAGGHHAVNHAKGEYARGSVHSNTAESFNGLFKRSIQGAWHHISREHIGRYLAEQCFRWSHRDVNDGERTVAALTRVGGVRLYYQTPQGHPEARGLVAGR
ncbi:MAG TPA: IS1595 family transposase [Planctomycetota bacterium]|nr:IS1595 family transposase [Planctomycetota bacterium]